MKVKRTRTILARPHDFPLMPQDHDAITWYLFHNYRSLFTRAESATYTYIIFEAKAAMSKAHAAATATSDKVSGLPPRPSTYASIKEETLASYPEITGILAKGNASYYEAVKERLFREHASEIVLNRCPKCETLCRTPQACLCPNTSCNHTWYETRQ